MKTTATTSRGGPRPRPGGRPAVARKARPGAAVVANHVRADAGLERQADEAAGRVARGERNVARLLTPAPAATVAVPASTAEPLPVDLRTELEAAFGADLAAVRIHRDSPGAAAARAEDALAFTAGRHIFFAAGAYDPASATGKVLLAHELAHVLQQTGRRESPELVRATDRIGEGELQRQPAPPGPPAKSLDDLIAEQVAKKGDVLAKVKDLFALHRAATGAEPGLMALGDAIDELVNGQPEPMPVWFLFDPAGNPLADGLETWLLAGKLPSGAALSTVARSLIVDVLKRMGPTYWPTVRTAIERDVKAELETIPVKLFERWLTSKVADAAWYLDAVAVHPRGRGFLDDALVATYAALLFNPWSATAVPLWGSDWSSGSAVSRSWADQFKRLNDDVKAAERVGTERLLVGMATLDKLDQQRRDDQTRFLTGMREAVGTLNPASQRRYLAGRVHAAYAAPTSGTTDPRIKEIERRIRDLAAEASRFWTKGEKLEADSQRALFATEWHQLTAPGTSSTLHGNIVTDDVLKGFGTFVAGQAKLLFARQTKLPEQPLPDAWTYSQRVATFRTALVGATPGLGGHVQTIQSAIYPIVTGKHVGAVSPNYAFILAWLTMFERAFPGYQPAKETTGTDDGRAAHRRATALMLLRLALYAGLDELAAVALPVVEGEGRPSRVALISDWIKQAAVTPSHLLVDFRDDPSARVVITGKTLAGGDLALDIPTLVKLFRAQRLDRLGAALEKVAAAKVGQAKLTRNDSVDLRPTSEAMKKLARPTRHKVESFAFLFNAADVAKARTSDGKLAWSKLPSSAELLNANAKTKQQLVAPTGGTIIVAKRNYGEVFAWVIPDLTPIIKLLRSSSQLTALVETSPGQPADDFAWLERLFTAVDQAKVTPAIDALVQQAATRATKGWRLLFSVLRRIAALRIEAYLDQWGGDRAKSGFITKALREFLDYQVNVMPLLDEPWQVGALALGVASKLDLLFTDERYREIPPNLGPYLDAGLAMSDGSPDHKAGLAAVCDDVAYGGDSAATLTGQRPALARVRARLDKANQELQDRFGFGVVDGRLKSLLSEITLEVGEEWTFEGVVYQVTAIHRGFAYHEPLSTSKVPSVLKDGIGGGLVARTSEPLLTVRLVMTDTPRISDRAAAALVGKVKPAAPPPAEAPASDDYQPPALQEGETAIGGPSYEVVVTGADADDGLLEQLSRAITGGAQMKGMQQLGQYVEIFGELTMTAAETFLPGGQAVSAARTAAQIAATLDNDDFRAFMDKLLKDPAEIVEEIKDRIVNGMTPENLWEFVFFGNPWLDKLAEAKGKLTGGKPRATKVAAGGKLGKIFRFVTNLGARLLSAYRGLKHAFRSPTAALHASIITHPVVNWILAKVMAILEWAAAHADELAHLGDDLSGQITGFRDQVAGFVQTLEELELPSEILPTKVMMEFLVDFAIGLIPKIKVMRPILDKAGITPLIAAEVAKVLDGMGFKESAFDVPNQLYRTHVRDVVDRELGTVRDQFVTDLRSIVNEGIEFLNSNLGTHLAPLVATADETAPIKPTYRAAEELELAVGDQPPTGEPVGLPADAGRPLAPSVRRAAEAHFAQDFGHVRLHRDGAAAHFTGALGADAATSGSHVYLRGGLAPEAGDGARVLRHELAHVVQQTGARPLGGDHPTHPVTGQRDRGLTHDPGREGAADRAAVSAAAAAALGAARPSATGAVEASFKTTTLPKIFKKMLIFRPEGTYLGVEPGGAKTPGRDDAYAIWKLVLDRIAKKDPKDFAAVFQAPQKVLDTVAGMVTAVDAKHADVGGVAALAQRLDRKDKTKKKTLLSVPRFVTLLEGWVFAKTGVAVQIGLASDKAPFALAKLRVGFVHLGFVTYAKGQALWDELLKTAGVKPGSWKATGATPDDVEKLVAGLRARVIAGGLDAFMFTRDKTSGGIRFSRGFIQDLEADRQVEVDKKAAAGGYPGDVLPAAEYANPAHLKTTSPLPIAGGGLRLGLHGFFKNQIPVEHRLGRDSHHLTQFLLIEYLRGRKGTKPLPPLSKTSELTLGLHRSGDLIDTIHVGARPHLLGALDKDDHRGDGMPALLIARETHQRGKLHVSGEPPDEYEGQSRQGNTLDNLFQRSLAWLPKRTGPYWTKKDGAAWDAEIAKAPAAAKERIAYAINRSYTWMYAEVMRPPILPALEKHEVRYHLTIAAAKDPTRLRATGQPTKAWDIRPFLSAVAAAADKWNVEVMETTSGFERKT